MKAVLEFNLPEDQEEFRMSKDGINAHLTIAEILNYFRQKLKYQKLSPVEYELYEKTREDIYKIIEDNEINI